MADLAVISVTARATALALLACVGACTDETKPAAAETSTGAESPDAATADAGTATPNAASRFCETLTSPIFCADFDGKRALEGWINTEDVPYPGEFGGGTMRTEVDAAPTRRTISRFTIPALLDDRARASAFLITQLSVPFVFDIAFKARIEQDLAASSAGLVRVFMLSYGSEYGYIGIERSAAKTELFVAERVDGALKAEYAEIDHAAMVNAWAPVAIHVENAPTGQNVSLAIGSGTVSVPLPSKFRGVQALTLSVGIVTAIGPLDGFRIDVDDVAVTRAP